MPTHRPKSTQAAGPPARPALFSSRVALQGLIPPRAGSTIVLVLSHHCQDELHSAQSSRLAWCLTGVPPWTPDHLQRSLNTLNAERSLCYSTPLGVFSFVPDKHRALTSGILNFTASVSSFPRLLKRGGGPLFPTPTRPPSSSGHSEFGSALACISLNYFLI